MFTYLLLFTLCNGGACVSVCSGCVFMYSVCLFLLSVLFLSFSFSVSTLRFFSLTLKDHSTVPQPTNQTTTQHGDRERKKEKAPQHDTTHIHTCVPCVTGVCVSDCIARCVSSPVPFEFRVFTPSSDPTVHTVSIDLIGRQRRWRSAAMVDIC